MYDDFGEVVLDDEDKSGVTLVVIFMPDWGLHAISVPDEDDLADWDEAFH